MGKRGAPEAPSRSKAAAAAASQKTKRARRKDAKIEAKMAAEKKDVEAPRRCCAIDEHYEPCAYEAAAGQPYCPDHLAFWLTCRIAYIKDGCQVDKLLPADSHVDECCNLECKEGQAHGLMCSCCPRVYHPVCAPEGSRMILDNENMVCAHCVTNPLIFNLLPLVARDPKAAANKAERNKKKAPKPPGAGGAASESSEEEEEKADMDFDSDVEEDDEEINSMHVRRAPDYSDDEGDLGHDDDGASVMSDRSLHASDYDSTGLEELEDKPAPSDGDREMIAKIRLQQLERKQRVINKDIAEQQRLLDGSGLGMYHPRAASRDDEDSRVQQFKLLVASSASAGEGLSSHNPKTCNDPECDLKGSTSLSFDIGTFITGASVAQSAKLLPLNYSVWSPEQQIAIESEFKTRGLKRSDTTPTRTALKPGVEQAINHLNLLRNGHIRKGQEVLEARNATCGTRLALIKEIADFVVEITAVSLKKASLHVDAVEYAEAVIDENLQAAVCPVPAHTAKQPRWHIITMLHQRAAFTRSGGGSSSGNKQSTGKASSSSPARAPGGGSSHPAVASSPSTDRCRNCNTNGHHIKNCPSPCTLQCPKCGAGNIHFFRKGVCPQWP